MQVPRINVLHQVSPLHHVQGDPQAVPDGVRHRLDILAIPRPATLSLEVERREEMFRSLSVGLQVDAGYPEVVATPGEPRAVPGQGLLSLCWERGESCYLRALW